MQSRRDLAGVYNVGKKVHSRIVTQQAALASFGDYALDENDLTSILREAVRVCAQILDVPVCKICRYDPVADSIMVVSAVGWRDGIVGHFETADDGIFPAWMTLRSGQPTILININQLATGEIVSIPSVYRDHGIISTANIPIRGGLNASMFGMLEIASSTRRQFPAHEIHFLRQFANILADRASTLETVNRLRSALHEKDHLLRQKEWLLAELHHRVRNNMQLVYGMLIDQNVRPDVIARRVLSLSQVYDHIDTMAATHLLEFGAYLQALCKTMEPVFEGGATICCEINMLPLDVDKASALGLAANEMLLIRLERRLPEHATVTVRLTSENGRGRLEVRDSSTEPCNESDNRYGVGLVKRLARQLKGNFEFSVCDGFVTALSFDAAHKKDASP